MEAKNSQQQSNEFELDDSTRCNMGRIGDGEAMKRQRRVNRFDTSQ